MPTDTGRFLASAARAAPSADSSQPFDFSWNGREFVVSFSVTRTQGKLFDASSPATLLSLGACLENVDAALCALGLSGGWHLKTSPAPSASSLPRSPRSSRPDGCRACASSMRFAKALDLP